jgi:hypothetical protein
VRRDEIEELGYITPIRNVPSIVKLGLLSHTRAARVLHLSIAKEGVQSIRAQKSVPNGLRLHDYVNLYFNPRNPMMYLRKDSHASCCILRIDPAVLDLEGVVVTDRNAARFAVFHSPDEGLALIDRDMAFAQYWTHDDPIEQDRRKALQCAEVLVPHVVPTEYVRGAWISCHPAAEALTALGFDLAIDQKPYLFFQP